MNSWHLLLVFCLFLLHVQLILSQCSSITAVTVSGKLLCEGLTFSPPLEVILIQDIGIVRNELGRFTSDENGYFEVTGFPIYVPEGEPELMLRMNYHSISETEQLLLSNSDYRRIEAAPGTSRIRMEPRNLSKHRCQSYMFFYQATVEYYERVGKRVPVKPRILVDEITNQVFPYVVYNEVISRKDFEWSFEVAQHELGHIIRHAFDGDETHFEQDERLYGSPDLRYHTCSSKSSEGFAFNEGWAFYWAGQCLDFGPTGSHEVHGIVAASLRNLQIVCNSSYKQMVQVLEDNPGVIHSFREYEERHKHMYDCP